MTDKLQALYEYNARHCIVCDAEVEPILLTDDRYVTTRWCNKPDCKKQQQEYYDSWW